MKKVLLDSDVIIDILRGFKETMKKVEELFEENELYISGITEMEIFAGKDMEKEEKRKKIVEMISKFKKVNPTNEIFRLAGDFRRRYNISIPNCLIAATAYSIGAILFTKNVQDFRKIEEIKILHV
jgi:predicted nucleic acid-binding protein